MDTNFQKQAEPWEKTEGYVYRMYVCIPQSVVLCSKYKSPLMCENNNVNFLC